jgi:uncharacterized membrane protein
MLPPRSFLRVSTVGLVLTAVVCFTAAPALAQKGKKPGGGGGGGSSTRFTVIELPFRGTPVAISDADATGVVTIAIESDEGGYGSGAFVHMDRDSGTVLASGFLPKLPFVDPNYGSLKSGSSSVADANVGGEIVGSMRVELDNVTSGPVLWSFDGTGYDFRILPLLPDHVGAHAQGINNWGDIVGSSRSGDFDVFSLVAVLWDAETHTPVDLNTEATAAAGWHLFQAFDINDDGLVVGGGLLDGNPRGYILDPLSGSIWAVPLIGPATRNVAASINASGRVAGFASNGDGMYQGTDPDYVQAFAWDGPGAVPVILPSVTNNTSHAFVLNDAGAVVGNSYYQTGDLLDPASIPTLWEFDDQGNVVATELAAAIPNKPSYELRTAACINNDGWIGLSGRKFEKGKYTSPALLLIPNAP